MDESEGEDDDFGEDDEDYGNRIVIQLDDAQFIVILDENRSKIYPSNIGVSSKWIPSQNSNTTLVSWTCVSPVNDKIVVNVVPSYSFDLVDGITLVFDDTNIAIHDKYGLVVDYNVPAPKYILRKQTRQIIDIMKEYLFRYHGKKFACSGPQSSFLKEYEKLSQAEREKISCLFGAKQLAFTYNSKPEYDELLDIFMELQLYVEQVLPSMILLFCEHICKSESSCCYCPVSQWCNKHKMQLATLGAGVSSLIPTLRTVTQTTTVSTQGLYRLANAGVGDALKVA